MSPDPAHTASRRRLLATLGAGSLIALAGCSSDTFAPDSPAERPPSSVASDDRTPSGVWTTAGGGLQNTRYADVTAVREPSVDRVNRFAGFVGTVTADRLYLTRPGPRGERSNLVATSLESGEPLWARELDDSVGDPTLFDSSLYVSRDGRVWKFDADGTPVWTVDLYTLLGEAVHASFLPDERDRFYLSTPVVASETVLLTSPFGLHGLSAETGAERWRLWVDDALRYPRRPSVAPEGLYFVGRGDDGATVSAVFDDEPVRLSGRLDSFCPPLAVGTDHVFGGPASRDSSGTRGTLYAAPRVRPDQRANADEWWFVGNHTSAPRGRKTTPPVVGPDHVFVADTVDIPDGIRATIYAIDPVGGTAVWSHRIDVENATPEFEPELQPVVAALAGTPDVLYAGVAPVVDASPTDPHVVDGEAGILALDAETGDPLWFQRVGFLPEEVAAVDAHVVASDRYRNLAVVGEA